MADDRIKREIEDILSRLDDLPAERKPIPFRRRSSRQPGSFGRGLIEPLTRISIRHAMLAALVLLVVGFFIQGTWEFGRWMLIAGLVLFVSCFVISFFNRGAGRGSTRSSGYQKRWRGQPMDLDQPNPTLSQRVRAWFARKSRP
jgi:hypothetical protein